MPPSLVSEGMEKRKQAREEKRTGEDFLVDDLKRCSKVDFVNGGGESRLTKKKEMNINDFLKWTQETYGLNDRHVVARAAALLGTTAASVYHWINGRRELQEPTKRLMTLTVEVEELRKSKKNENEN